ncbi:response regulator [Methylophilus sp. 13]|uniref:response regulator n=1 Tax=Methylophilus sp. 13 TaxID=2781018 RepID=UPI00188E9582|nr:response regulator [Methylophilus sp. 13]MBF5039756.1 response regulator [Methylophilus sp. 13]
MDSVKVFRAQNNRIPQDQEVLSTKDASKLLDLSVATVQKLVENGLLEAWKTKGGHRRILKSSIINYASSINKTDLASAAKLSVLIVEDNQELARLYALKIAEWQLDIELEIVNSGIEGLIQLVKSVPDILITDLKMQGIDGFQLLSILKDDYSLQSINIIVATGLTPAQIEGKIPDSGITVLHKPINFEFLHGYFVAQISNKIKTGFNRL